MTNHMPTDLKKHCKNTKPQIHQTAKMFFFLSSSSYVLVQNCVKLCDFFTMVFAQKQQHFALSSAPVHRFFTTLKLMRQFKPVTKEL